jgi:hypothetical protein
LEFKKGAIMSRRVLPLLALVCLLVGCGRSGIQARGRLVKNGDVFVPGDAETVRIAFFPASEEENSRSYLANFDPKDGTFQAAGRGVPPGKYRLTVSIIKDRKDQLKGAFNAKNSPFLHEVVSASDEITLDLATPSKTEPPVQSGKTKSVGPAQPAKSIRKSKS